MVGPVYAMVAARSARRCTDWGKARLSRKIHWSPDLGLLQKAEIKVYVLRSLVLIVAEFLRCFSLISIVQNTTSFTPKPAPIPCYWYGPVLCCKSVPPRRDEIRDVHF